MSNQMYLWNSISVLLSKFISQPELAKQNDGLNCVEMATQPGCFELGNFGVTLVACIVAIITCVFTILMYHYVKKQLELARKQLEDQWTTSKINEEARKESMDKTTQYVGQVKNQILNNTLVNLVEKKQQFLQDYDYLYGYLSENPYLLKSGKIYQKVSDLRKTIDGIVVRLDSIKDILGLFIKQNDSLSNCYDNITNSIDELKNKEIIAHNMVEEDNWLDDFLKNRKDLTIEIDKAIEQIKNDIKIQKL